MKPNTAQALTGSLVMTLAELDSVNGNQQWVHLLPVGEFSASDGRGPWVVDNPEQVIANTLNKAGSKKIPIDYDHQIDHATQNGQPAIAAGWITQFESRDSGIWGFVEWTDKARAHLAAKEYRYLSPVIKYTEQGQVTTLLRAALTNKPALELTALASQQEGNLQAELISTQAKLQDALALAEKVQKEANEQKVANLVDIAAKQGRILPYQRDFSAKLCEIDTELFDQFVSMVAPNNLALFKEYDCGEHKKQQHTQALSEVDQTICKAMGHSQEEFIQLGATNDH